MRKQKQIVGKFNNDLSRIEFYEIIDNFKQYTLIRKQGTSNHYLFDNKASLLSNEFYIDKDFSMIADINNLLEDIEEWSYNQIFFWADSVFVTKFGTEEYHKLVRVYHQLLNIKESEVFTEFLLTGLFESTRFFECIKYKWQYFKLKMQSRRMIKKFEKEYKIIW